MDICIFVGSYGGIELPLDDVAFRTEDISDGV
ncbi:hypothetical protein NX02_09115 [Sphingomonas sanxanigenens DSM 19645 = NX02]|uniref:Uncharacterized protein n=1 Tax=Sphingomonas sanxanigenens DSM 19645 = NX02 TaxID=1123269 RepID=W0A6I4_9SPHN|nr:hypothetical protein NX02_09115 [Sphingomonas sanxanigenens DSM 19645 = NX02]